MWDLNSSAYLKQDRSRGHLKRVTDIAVTSDGSRCVSASRDGSLKIWNCETAEECFTLRGEVRFVHLFINSTVTKLQIPVRRLQTSKSSLLNFLIKIILVVCIANMFSRLEICLLSKCTCQEKTLESSSVG